MDTLTPVMAKKKPKKPEGKASSPRYPSRDKVAYYGIPVEYADALQKLTDEDPKFEDRSIAWLVTRAVRNFLNELGRLPPKSGTDPGE